MPPVPGSPKYFKGVQSQETVKCTVGKWLLCGKLVCSQVTLAAVFILSLGCYCEWWWAIVLGSDSYKLQDLGQIKLPWSLCSLSHKDNLCIGRIIGGKDPQGSLHHILDRENTWCTLFSAMVCLVHIWPTSDIWGTRSCLDPSALIYLWNNLLSFLPFQIQFKEKVLWTAITLFIFLVCCQVSSALVLVGVTGLGTSVWYLLSPICRFPCLASCLQTLLTLSTGCEWF